jgi:uncharacterized membrane protein
MSEVLYHPLFMAALWFAVIIALTALVVLVARRYRGSTAQDGPSANDLLAKFRDLHVQGGLSDDEYRTIKTKLATQQHEELSDSDQTSE